MEMTTCTGLRSEGTPDAESVADSDRRRRVAPTLPARCLVSPGLLIPCCADTRPREKSRKIVSDRQTINLRTLNRVAPLRQASAMDSLPRPLAFLLLLVSGWVNRQQQAVIDYLLEENRILRAAHAPRRLRVTDDQRRRLAVKGSVLGRRRLADVSGIVTPDTILRWYRRLVAQKYDGSHTRRPGRPSTKPDIAALWCAWRTGIPPGAPRVSAVG